MVTSSTDPPCHILPEQKRDPPAPLASSLAISHLAADLPPSFCVARQSHLPSIDPCLDASLCVCSFVCMHACDFFPCVYVCARNPSPTEMSVAPWAGTRDQAAAEDTHSTSEASSQDLEQHPDKLCLDSFWSEVETIRQGCGYPEPDCTRRDSRQSEGARVSYHVLLRLKQRITADRRTYRDSEQKCPTSEVMRVVIQS